MTRHWGRWEVIGRPSRGFAESPSRYPAGSHTEDHENGAVSTSEGGAVSRPDDVSSSSICFYVRSIIPISRAFDARRRQVSSLILPLENAFYIVFFFPSAGVVHANACCSPRTDQSRKYARLPPRVSRTTYVSIYPPTLKVLSQRQSIFLFYVLCTNRMYVYCFHNSCKLLFLADVFLG